MNKKQFQVNKIYQNINGEKYKVLEIIRVNKSYFPGTAFGISNEMKVVKMRGCVYKKEDAFNVLIKINPKTKIEQFELIRHAKYQKCFVRACDIVKGNKNGK